MILWLDLYLWNFVPLINMPSSLVIIVKGIFIWIDDGFVIRDWIWISVIMIPWEKLQTWFLMRKPITRKMSRYHRPLQAQNDMIFNRTLSSALKNQDISCYIGCINQHLKTQGVKNAFLHGDLCEKVYMQSLPCLHPPHQIYRLCHTLCGLKQAPHSWFKKFNLVVFHLVRKPLPYCEVI